MIWWLSALTRCTWYSNNIPAIGNVTEPLTLHKPLTSFSQTWYLCSALFWTVWTLSSSYEKGMRIFWLSHNLERVSTMKSSISLYCLLFRQNLHITHTYMYMYIYKHKHQQCKQTHGKLQKTSIITTNTFLKIKCISIDVRLWQNRTQTSCSVIF